MTLFIVSTPIGNLEDITLRALRVLKEADMIACEDTRRTQKLLQYYDIHKHLISYHAHSHTARIQEIIHLLQKGHNIALVTDSGTPGISDPGCGLITSAVHCSIPVQPVPGPSAVAAACACAGLPCDRFTFVGFLPRRKARAARILTAAYALEQTVVLYESPYRVNTTLGLLEELFGDAVQVVIARELTKKFEEILRGSLQEIRHTLKNRDIRGEVVILFRQEEKLNQ